MTVAVYRAFIYHIWRARNQKIFTQQAITHNMIIQQVKFVLIERLNMYRDAKRAKYDKYFGDSTCT